MRAALLVALVASLAATAYIVRVRERMVDFEVYRTAGARAALAEPLYQASDGHYQFKYFPAAAFLFTPLALLPAGIAKAGWFALSVGLLAVLIALSVRQLPSRTVPTSLIVAGTIVTLGKFYAHELELGQANLLFAVSTMAAVALLQTERSAGAGAAFAMAAVVKPYGLVFLPYLLATKQFRAAAACAAVVLLALAAPAIAYGLQGNLDLLAAWWQTVTTSTPPNLINQDNVSIAAMYTKWLGPGPFAGWLTLATSVALIALCVAVVAMRRPSASPEYLEIALLLTAVAMLSPQGWDYVLLLSTPAVAMLVNDIPRFSRAIQVGTLACLAVVGLTIYDIVGRAAYLQFMRLSILTLLYGVIVCVIVHVRARQLQ